MKFGSLAAFVLLGLVILPPVTQQQDESSSNEDIIEAQSKRMDSLQNSLYEVARQVILQQLFIEERIRSDGDSGVKQIRHIREGTRNYYGETHTSTNRLLAIHDHSNNIRTVGLGEFVAVLNGVEFRTRHNDYRLNMPNTTSKEYGAIEPIPFPEVPPEVKEKETVDEQIEEMYEWFKAWRDQDPSVRDYRKYFKPVLCYLEGAWTYPSSEIEEPFESDRHFIDAKSWHDLEEKVRFTSYSGRKDNLENYSYLPRVILGIKEDATPILAQWNYRILCHPLSRDIPLNRFRVVDEFSPRLPVSRSLKDHAKTRAARFTLNPFDNDEWEDGMVWNKYGLLDELMAEIPGKDNYQGNLEDSAFGVTAYSLNPKEPEKKLNAAYYHRWFKVLKKGAMGLATRHRGFSDENLFMAMTTQPKVAGMDLKTCTGRGKKQVCETFNQKFSYAIPLEIIWMTPLSNWNPLNIEYKGKANTDYGKSIHDGGRFGGLNENKAINGTNSKKYYITPLEFFSGSGVGSDAADTTASAMGVLDKDGNFHTTAATGTRVFFPPIYGVGTLRQRYPIMPVHGEGSSTWKELEATKDILTQSQTNGYLLKEPLDSSKPLPTPPTHHPLTLKMIDAKKTPPGPHSHEVTLTAKEVELAKMEGVVFRKTTTFRAGHEHTITFTWKEGPRASFWDLLSCDSYDTKATRCQDQHGKKLLEVTTI